MIENIHKDIQPNLRKYNQELVDMKPQEMLTWGYEKFDNQFAITTSFGIQSSVLLNMVSKLFLQKKNQNILDRHRLPTSRNIPLR
jgi:phosphoadenosine phosphosulfate reductase